MGGVIYPALRNNLGKMSYLCGEMKNLVSNLALTTKSIVKLALLTHRAPAPEKPQGEVLIVMGNGPSLSDAIAQSGDVMARYPLLAVNFAALTDEFFRLKPRYYLMADPVFFAADGNGNLRKLRENLGRVDWPMTLYVPFGAGNLPCADNSNVTVSRFNFVGLGGFRWFERLVYGSGRGIPRPRNVLIPAIMAGIRAGYKTIYLVGADHSWTRTLAVDEDNTVVSIQPHFYEDNEEERKRVRAVYKNIRLHEVIYSFYVAFKSYFAVRRYADSVGVKIYNSTSGSFIDAFERRPLPKA